MHVAPARSRPTAYAVAVVSLALLSLLSIACSKPVAPTLAPEKVELTSFSAAGVNVNVHLAATNPNRNDLEVRSMTGKVRLDGKFDLGSTTVDKAVTLPAGRTTSIEAPLALPWANIPALLALAAAQRDVPFEVEGTVNLGGDLLNVSAPFKITETATHAQIVRATSASLPGLALPAAP